MIRKKLLAAALAVTMVLTGLPGQTVKSRAATEITLAKASTPIPLAVWTTMETGSTAVIHRYW